MRNRIYISGKITDTTDYMERFRKAEEYLASRGFSPVNPARVNAMMPEDTTYEEYMIVSFAMIETCNSIYMLDGWENSNGARLEHEKAKEKGIEIIYQIPSWKVRMYNTFMSRQV